MANEALAALDAIVVDLLQDAASNLTQPQRWTAARSARAEYEKIFPRRVSVAIAGADAFDYALSTALPLFVDGFSIITGVWYPYSAAARNVPPLPKSQYGLFPLVAGLALRFVAATPAVGESILVVHTAPHTLATSTTVPTTDLEALADLTASYCALQLSQLSTQETNSSLGADVMDRLTKAEHYRANSTRFREAYQRKMSEGGTARVAALEIAHPPAPTSGAPLTAMSRSLFH